ncbi:hypothetical protein ONZ45_g13438 [Pleurotus djamor]|nr:hypothetical protein ONZ45_g13438 [Pleurotus djamor]
MAIDNTMGATLLGAMGAAILFGITNIQVFNYFMWYPTDALFNKVIVLFLWAFEVFHVFLTTHAIYFYLISSFGDVPALDKIVWSFKLKFAITVLAILFVQGLYTLRVWKLSRYFHRLLPIVVVGVVVIGFGIGILFVVKLYTGWDRFSSKGNEWVLHLFFSYSTFVDFVIMISLCYHLQRSRSYFVETNSKVRRVMQYAVATGLTTTACSVATMICYILMPHNLVYIGVEQILARLYINSFIALLNTRKLRVTANMPYPNAGPLGVNVSTCTHVTDVMTDGSKKPIGGMMALHEVKFKSNKDHVEVKSPPSALSFSQPLRGIRSSSIDPPSTTYESFEEDVRVTNLASANGSVMVIDYAHMDQKHVDSDESDSLGRR